MSLTALQTLNQQSKQDDLPAALKHVVADTKPVGASICM
jgi:hypothetical protein